MTPEFSLQIFEKYSNIIFHGNHPIGNCGVVQCGRRDERMGGWTDRRRGITKPIFAFRNFANALLMVVTKRDLYLTHV